MACASISDVAHLQNGKGRFKRSSSVRLVEVAKTKQIQCSAHTILSPPLTDEADDCRETRRDGDLRRSWLT